MISKKKQHMGQKRFVAVCDISCCWYGTGLETSEEDLEVLRLTAGLWIVFLNNCVLSN